MATRRAKRLREIGVVVTVVFVAARFVMGDGAPSPVDPVTGPCVRIQVVVLVEGLP